MVGELVRLFPSERVKKKTVSGRGTYAQVQVRCIYTLPTHHFSPLSAADCRSRPLPSRRSQARRVGWLQFRVGMRILVTSDLVNTGSREERERERDRGKGESFKFNAVRFISGCGLLDGRNDLIRACARRQATPPSRGNSISLRR